MEITKHFCFLATIPRLSISLVKAAAGVHFSTHQVMFAEAFAGNLSDKTPCTADKQSMQPLPVCHIPDTHV
ncbi:hypothetical protein Q0590_24460 [Rhodocytophaga aerolata]|uniref:Secreted protein n=1 Tax=Rhodocytophaga aerolata TaxID=455078 RepID=A0ABT8RBH1_9BACT|nr:hypothetical protein [Rhodocytophaga aerolata]MDO1449451.1 hypothetical protein [Rhodocytophaga aerolata]